MAGEYTSTLHRSAGTRILESHSAGRLQPFDCCSGLQTMHLLGYVFISGKEIRHKDLSKLNSEAEETLECYWLKKRFVENTV